MRSSLAVVALLACLASPALLAHGASKGLHLHVAPDPAEPGETVTVEVDASRPLRSVEIGFVGQDGATVGFDPPARHAAIELRVPPTVEGDTINVQAEATTRDGDVLRASAVVRVEREP